MFCWVYEKLIGLDKLDSSFVTIAKWATRRQKTCETISLVDLAVSTKR